jgi:hypothetical protein
MARMRAPTVPRLAGLLGTGSLGLYVVVKPQSAYRFYLDLRPIDSEHGEAEEHFGIHTGFGTVLPSFEFGLQTYNPCLRSISLLAVAPFRAAIRIGYRPLRHIRNLSPFP